MTTADKLFAGLISLTMLAVLVTSSSHTSGAIKAGFSAMTLLVSSIMRPVATASASTQNRGTSPLPNAQPGGGS
jgi:hypothetical protein